METKMEGFRCWSGESVAETVYSDIGALSSDANAVFLAAHTPVVLDHRKGSETKRADSGEAQVLNALLRHVGEQTDRNTLVAVTGDSGSGKSHVVRWVHAQLDEGDRRFRVLYVPRAVQTIRELLRRIIDGLPGVEGSDLMDRVDDAISGSTPGELLDRVVSEMRIALNWSIDERAPDEGETETEAAAREDRNGLLGERDAQHRRRDGLADLLENPIINKTLLRSESNLSKLIYSYFSETSRRDETDEIFTIDDLPTGTSGILASLRGRGELRELWEIIRRQPEDALSLLEESLRIALPKVLGLVSPGGETLDTLFRDSRRALRLQNQELVLIFEDLAQFGLIDGELYEQFATAPGADMAPLRVLFAVTDGPFGKMPKTVRTRVEHEFRVGGSVLDNPEKFLGRYLNVVRTGREKLQSSWDGRSSAGGSNGWVPNACDTRESGSPCRFKDRCHSAFGAVEIDGLGDVGLYPYNVSALRRAFLQVGKGASPRAVLDHCMSEIMAEADVHIGARDFPHERTWKQFDINIRIQKDALLNRYPSSDPERWYRAMVIWGDEAPIKPGIQDAFALESTISSSTVEKSDTYAGSPAVISERVVDFPPGPTVLSTPLQPLFQWEVDKTRPMPDDDVNLLRNLMYWFVSERLNLDQDLLHIRGGFGKAWLDKVFNMTSFSIEGSRGRTIGSGGISFQLKRDSADVRFLAAIRWFDDHGHFIPNKGIWAWPEGFDPAKIMIEFEVRLDDWATQVREKFIAHTGGREIASRAIGLRALALACVGHDVDGLNSTASVLEAEVETNAIPSDAWRNVDQVARRVLASQTYDLIGSFASVRQGDSGQPQLVDTGALDFAVAKFVNEPVGSLKSAMTAKSDPVAAQTAGEFLDELKAAETAELATVSRLRSIVKDNLEGCEPAYIGNVALEVGRKARDNGLFRPVEVGSWNRFLDAINVLEEFGSDTAEINAKDIADLVRGQNPLRQKVRLSKALEIVKTSMLATREECVRSGTRAGDLAEVRLSVKRQLAEVLEILHATGVGYET